MFCKQIKLTEENKININEEQKKLVVAKKQIAAEVKKLGGQTRWDTSTRWLELSAVLLKYIKHNKSKSSSVPHNISNAYLKCWEMLNIVSGFFYGKDINHFDNASLPGDFIRSTSLWLTINAPNSKYDWKANSLIADDALEDRFNLIRDNPTKWMMSDKMNGDVTRKENINIIKYNLKNWKPNLYTSDLGFRMNNKFEEEEEHLACNIGQILLGLEILAPGGIMITKQFTIFTKISRVILLLLKKIFSQVWVVKPQTSKADNSEIYIISINYKPDIEITKKFRNHDFNIDVDNNNIGYLISLITQRQVDKINANLLYSTTEDLEYKSKNWCFANSFNLA